MMSYLYQITLLSIVIRHIKTLPAIRIVLIVIGSGIGLEKKPEQDTKSIYLCITPLQTLDVSGKRRYQAALVNPIRNQPKSYLYMGKIKKYPIYKDEKLIGYEAPEKEIQIIVCDKKEADPIIIKNHYSHKVTKNSFLSFLVYYKGEVHGAL